LGDGFVARNLSDALQGRRRAGREGAGSIGVHGGHFITFDKGRHPWQTRPSDNLFFTGTRELVKADLGTKRGCPSCGTRFYDLTKRPIECPKCGFSFEPEALYKQRRGRQPEPAVAATVVRAEEAEDEEEDDENEDGESEAEEEEEPAVVEAPLVVAATGEDEDETAEEEEAEAESGMSVVEGDEEVAIEDIEVEDDEEEEADDGLLAEVEDEEDDVAGIIDPGIAKDEA
jgi:uncharacterized protein (TIGR02300 family)